MRPKTFMWSDYGAPTQKHWRSPSRRSTRSSIGPKILVVAGGVGANAELRRQLNTACAKRHVRVHYPELSLCTDNGAMIAMAASMRP